MMCTVLQRNAVKRLPLCYVCSAALCYAIPCHIMPCYLSYALLCSAVLCSAVPCCPLLSRATLCYAITVDSVRPHPVWMLLEIGAVYSGYFQGQVLTISANKFELPPNPGCTSLMLVCTFSTRPWAAIRCSAASVIIGYQLFQLACGF